MEIRTYTAGFSEGWIFALKSLDRQVKDDLGTNVRIINVQDTLYRKKDLSFIRETNDFDDRIARVVVFETASK